jgi:hypothetical protein
LSEELGRTRSDHEVVSAPKACFLEAARLVHEARRVLRVNREGNLAIPVLPGGRQRGCHHGLPEPSTLKLRLKCDTELWSLIVDVGEALTPWNQAHPACPSFVTIHNGDETNVCG